MADSGIKSTAVFNISSRTAYKLIPKSWHRQAIWGQWDVISHSQFRATLGLELVRLDKAILTSTIVNHSINHSENDYNYKIDENKEIDEKIFCFIPSTYVIDGLDRVLRHDEDVVDILMQKTGQRRILFDEIARGYAVVEYIADGIMNAAKEIGIKRLDIRLLKDRKDGMTGRLTRPVFGQNLDLEKISEFYMV